MQIRVLPDIEAISHEAARIFVRLSKEYIRDKGRFAAAISGGSTPRRFYQILSSEQYRAEVDWGKIHFFWVDERCVPKESESSNFRLTSDNLISRISIPDENIHRMRGEYGPERGAQDYEGEIRNFFGDSLPVFDLILLGMGEDGHTASLFPGAKSLDEKERLVIPVYAEKMNRITLTLPVLNSARHTLFLVSGRSKEDAVKDIMEDEEKRERYPAGLVHPLHGDVVWLVDKAAAGKLKRVQ